MRLGHAHAWLAISRACPGEDALRRIAALGNEPKREIGDGILDVAHNTSEVVK